jgi:hypothetical protein
VRICGYFSKPKGVREQKSLGNTSIDHWRNDTDRRIRSTRTETCPIATMSATNFTRNEQGSNAGHHGARPAANRLNRRVKLNLYNVACSGLGGVGLY